MELYENFVFTSPWPSINPEDKTLQSFRSVYIIKTQIQCFCKWQDIYFHLICVRLCQSIFVIKRKEILLRTIFISRPYVLRANVLINWTNILANPRIKDQTLVPAYIWKLTLLAFLLLSISWWNKITRDDLQTWGRRRRKKRKTNSN